MTKIESKETPYGSDVKITIPGKKPDLKNFYLSRIELEPADNGTIVECHYRIKPGASKKAKETGDYESHYPSRKYLAQDDDEVLAYIKEALSHLNAGGWKG